MIMKQFLFHCCMLVTATCFATITPVKNIDELKKANKTAKPGDIIVLQNAAWDNVIIELNCNGTQAEPITFKVQTPGQLKITGKSRLELGGSFIVVDGLYFVNGYSGDDPVINFRIDKNQLANDCRITNCVIDDFNNPKRMDENYWVSLSGKRNRIDHCTFKNKKNMGVLMAVILDDDRSRENFHSIDHNYFGTRLPLASNSGEIIRIGVSQHCEFNSNTQVVNNFFEHCDGETEIVSVKSCSNVVRNNLFKECQGGVVLRHGNYNTVENNIFWGNGKEGTGGVRIINRGQWVVNNYFYKCRGVGFRSPLSVMNGVPNSPANRYVPVTDALIANNSFIECTPISLCEGSDTERSVVPSHVIFQNNVFKNTNDKKIFNAYDDISKITFISNAVSASVTQDLPKGFKIKQTRETLTFADDRMYLKTNFRDSLIKVAKIRLAGKLNPIAGFDDTKYNEINANALNSCGALWLKKMAVAKPALVKTVVAKDGEELAQTLSTFSNAPLFIKLTGTNYSIDKPIVIDGNVTIGSSNSKVVFTSGSQSYIFQIKGGSKVKFSNFNADLSGVKADKFITSDINGSVNHSVLQLDKVKLENMNGDIFYAAKATMLDSVAVTGSSFNNIKGKVFNIYNEDDKKGYYNTEHFTVKNCVFNNVNGQILTMLRGGNDESTMGPLLTFTDNKITNATASANEPLILLNGTQVSFIKRNSFTNAAAGQTVLNFTDAVRAVHTFEDNIFKSSGKIVTDKFTTEKNNLTQ